MSKIAGNLENYLSSLCRQAKDMGASQAEVIPASGIVMDKRILLKCQVPLCPHYGRDLTCPPNTLSGSEFKGILGSYQHAILVKVDIPSSTAAGRASADYQHRLDDTRKKLHEIVSQLESLCLAGGHHLAAGLIGGSCPLCEECVGVQSGQPCRHPLRARPSMEAMGIDVVKTAGKVGLNIGFGQDESRSWVGLVLVA